MDRELLTPFAILRVMGKEFRAEPPHMTTFSPGWRGPFAPAPLAAAPSPVILSRYGLPISPARLGRRAESIRVATIEAFALDPLKHVSEIDIAGARLQMNFVAVTKTIGKAHLFDPAYVE